MNSKKEEKNQIILACNSNEYIKMIFSKEMPNPDPSFSMDFMNSIPLITNSDNIDENNQNLRSIFKLDLQSRLQIIDFLLSEPPEIHLSDINKEFASKLCLQSCCAVFFTLDDKNSLRYLNNEIFENLFKALMLSFDLVQSNDILIFQFISIVLDKISHLFIDMNNLDQDFEKLMQFLEIIIRFLTTLTNNERYQIEIIPSYVIIPFLDISNRIVDSIHSISIDDNANSTEASSYSLIEDYFLKIQRFFVQIKKFIRRSEKIDSITQILFQKIGEIAISDKSNSLSSLVIQILSFAVELSSLTAIKFIQINNSLKKWLLNGSDEVENFNITLHFTNETNKSSNQSKISIIKESFSSLKIDSISSLIDFQSKNEIMSLFSHVESKLHLFGLIFNEDSFLTQNISSNFYVWLLYIAIINDFLIKQTDLFNLGEFNYYDDDSNDKDEQIKSGENERRRNIELIFRFLVPQQFFTSSFLNDEKIDLLKVKILSLNSYLNLLKNSDECKENSCVTSDEICEQMKMPLINLFENYSIKSIESFYENLILSSKILQNIYLFDNKYLDKNHQLICSIKNCLKCFLSADSNEEIQIEILNVLNDLISSEIFIAYSTNCSLAFQLFLFLLDNCEKSFNSEILHKLNENFFQNVFDFGAKYPDLINYEVVSECIESMSNSRKIKVICILCNALKNIIFIITNNNYYNNNNFINSKQSNGAKNASYSWIQYQTFLKKVYKSKIQKIVVELISKGENVSSLLDFLSLSSFISSQSSQFTYQAPAIVKITSSLLGQSNDTFLLMNNSSNSFIAYVDWLFVAEELKKIKITRESYIEMLQILSAYSIITYPMSLINQEKDEDIDEISLTSVFLFGMNNTNASSLISVILKTKYAKDFLETLHEMVLGSVIQAIKLFKSNGLLILLDSISSLYENENFKQNEVTDLIEIILKITVYVVTFICSKEVCEKFQKVFYEFKKDQIKNEINFIDSFKSSLTPNPLFTSNFFHFNSTNSLFFLPPVPTSYIENGVSFVTELLIPSFGEISSSFFSFYNKEAESDVVEDELFELPIFYIASENDRNNGYNYLVISLFRNKISFASNIFEGTVYTSIDVPQNEWFTLSISIKKWKQFKVQIIENQKISTNEGGKKSQQIIKTREVEANLVGQWSIPIHRIEMFNISFFSPSNVIKQFKSQRKIEGLIRRVMLFSGNFQFAQTDMQQQQQQEVQEDVAHSIVCRNQQLFGHFTPQYCSLPESKLVNMVQNSQESSIFMINTEPIPLSNELFVCPFGDFFLKFNGLIEFVLYFSKSGLNEEELNLLLETLLFLFDRFPSLQKEMYEISGYHLIAHFLNTRKNFEVNERFFDEICKIEEKTTNESLLNQLRNNLIINFPKNLECNDNELFFRILKKWQDYDSSFFRSHVSFSKFCYIMFNQFSERKDKIDLSIKKSLMSILVVNSQFLEKQDLYLLTQLTGKLASYDVDTSILLIKEIYGITKDHPTKLDTVQRGLIEINNKAPEILCLIVKLFDTDDEYTKRLLYTEMSEKKTPEERSEFVLCFFNSIFNTHKRLSFEELLRLDEFHLVSVNLLLFILSFGFECEKSVVSSIVSLFNTIFVKKPETAKFVSNYIGMNSITLFIFISFAVFKSHQILNFVMSLIYSKISLLADSLRIISVLSAYCRKDLSEYQSLILNSFILKTMESVIDKNSDEIFENLNEVVDIIVNFVCFGPNRSVFDTTAALNKAKNQARNSEEIEFSLVDFFKAYLEYPIAIDQNEYGIFLNENGYWTDMKTVELLLTLVGTEGLNEESNKNLMILFSFLINKYNQIPAQKVAEILDRINTMCDSYFYTYEGSRVVINENKTGSMPFYDSLIPVLLSLHQNCREKIAEINDYSDDISNNNIKIISAFLNSFDVSNELFDIYNAIIESFVSNLHEISNVNERLLTGLTNESLIKEEKVTIDEAFADVKQKEITLSIHREKIYRKHRPVYLPENSYRRYNIFDEYFRPFMLTNKERLKFIQIDSPVFNDNTLGSGESSIKDEDVLWSSPCQRIKVDQTFDGYFSVTNKGYRFITPKGKSYRLLKSSIRYVFWNYCNNEPLSFTIFLLNGKCFLFRFFKPETRESIIEKLSMIELENCHFFQSRKGYEEVGKLKLTQRWRDRSISNFDYLMWLNLLSGRTFIDPDYYPIFPLLFSSAVDKTEMRDIEKNVIFMCGNNVRKWKDIRLTYDPYDNFLLNKSFSTQQVVCTFLDGIEQFKKREMKDAEQVHNQHYFYSSFDDIRSRNKSIDFRSTKEKFDMVNKELKGCKSCSQIKSFSNNKTSTTALLDVNNDMEQLRTFNGLIEGLKASEVHTELIPEFFFLPEVFKMWQTDSSQSSSFPLWAPTASKFILEHISAIESEEVSMNLHKWIDIIWGGRQNDYMYNPALSFASNDKNVQKHLMMLNLENDGVGFEGHLPPVFFAGPHPPRNTLPSFQSSTSVVKIEMKKKKKKNSLKIDFQPLVNDFFVNNSRNNSAAEEETTASASENKKENENQISFEKVGRFQSSAAIEEIDIEAAIQHERSILQMMQTESVDPISIGVVNMKKRNIYIVFSNEKVVQLPGIETINFTKQLEESRQNQLALVQNSHTANPSLNSVIQPNYGDKTMFCFSETSLYFVPLGSRSIFCFDFAYNKLFTIACSKSSFTAHLYSVTCIDCSENFVVSGSKDTSIIAWKKEPNGISPFKLLLSHQKPLKMLKIVRKMRILLSVDDGGSLCISMFPFLRMIKKIQLEFVPDFVDMTRCCIIAFCGRKVQSFTSNGEKIAERTFNGFSVVCEVAVDVVSRSDVVLIATTNKEILLLNCVSLEIVGVLMKLESVARLMKFDENSGTVAVVTESQEVVFTQIPD